MSKGLNISVAGHSIDHVGEKVGKAVDKVAGDKLKKVDAEKIGKTIDKTNKHLDVDMKDIKKLKK